MLSFIYIVHYNPHKQLNTQGFTSWQSTQHAFGVFTQEELSYESEQKVDNTSRLALALALALAAWKVNKTCISLITHEHLLPERFRFRFS